MDNMPNPMPIFDQADYLSSTPPQHIDLCLKKMQLPQSEYTTCAQFLLEYRNSPDTFNAYRREIERFCQWAWLIEKQSVLTLSREDILSYIDFATQPPLTWIIMQSKPRFTAQDGLRIPNPHWRPFLMRANKSDHKAGIKPTSKKNYHMTPATLRALFAGISTFYTYLQQEQLITHHPVQSIRQKNRFFQKNQTKRMPRTLSAKQWNTIIECVQAQILIDERFERHLFVLSAFYLLGLRISELAPSHRHTPVMSDFFKDHYNLWWFVTIGKGNKEREIAVPDAMITALARYRQFLNLTTRLPVRGDQTPLLPKFKGHGSIGLRQLRNIVQVCFDLAVNHLRAQQAHDAADELLAATAHWLRHTAITADVQHRPREHVRDDAGHESVSITDQYIDIDRRARHNSAKHKPLLSSTSYPEAAHTETKESL